MTGGVGGGRHALGLGEIQGGAGFKSQRAAAVGVFLDTGDAVRLLHRCGGGAVFHDLIHGGAVKFLHELAADALAVGPNHFIDGGADAVRAFLDHPLGALGELGIGYPYRVEGLHLPDLVIVGDILRHGQDQLLIGQVHRHHFQWAEGDAHAGQKGGDVLLFGDCGEGLAVVANGDIQLGVQADIVALAAGGHIHHAVRQVRDVLRAVQYNSGILHARQNIQSAGPVSGSGAGAQHGSQGNEDQSGRLQVFTQFFSQVMCSQNHTS